MDGNSNVSPVETDTEAFLVVDMQCRHGHKFKRNKWLDGICPNLCLYCYGKRPTLEILCRSLKASAFEKSNAAYEFYWRDHYYKQDADASIYLLTCCNGHKWHSPLSYALMGIWCGRCYPICAKFKIPVQVISNDEITSVLMTVRYNGEIVPLPFDAVVNHYERLKLSCSNGHHFITAPFLQYPRQWCIECQGVDNALTILLNNVGRKCKVSVHEDYYFPDIPSIPEVMKEDVYDFTCKCGNVFTDYIDNVLSGYWCNKCLELVFEERGIRTQLAASFGGRYTDKVKNSLGWYIPIFKCRKKLQISANNNDIFRGARCTAHDDCIVITSKEMTAFRVPALYSDIIVFNRKERLIRRAMGLDTERELIKSELEDAVNKNLYETYIHYYQLVRYNTIYKIRELARIRGGQCLAETYEGGNQELEWTCNTAHEDKVDRYTWKDTVFNVAEGAWCPYCKILRSKRSMGNMLIERYLVEEDHEYVREYGFKNCRYNRILRFDFYIPRLNTLIEFDGQQHFKPIDHFGGHEGFKNTVIRDLIKAQYCFENRIRLIRINCLNSVRSDLNRLLSKPPNVMVIAIDREYFDPEFCRCLKMGREDYVEVGFN